MSSRINFTSTLTDSRTEVKKKYSVSLANGVISLYMDFIDISNIKEGEELSEVRFECTCGHVLCTMPVEKTHGTWSSLDFLNRLRMDIATVSQKPCTACGERSDFEFRPADKKADALDKLREKEKADAPRRVTELCDVLTSNLRLLPPEMMLRIQRLMLEGRTRRVRFRVKPLEDRQAT
jgi:hypothetical protein